MKIVLSGEPRSTQHIYRSTCRGGFATTYMTPEGKTLKQAYRWEARAQWRGKPLVDDVEVWITLCFGTRRRNDWDNFHKLSMDALTGIVWLDDSQVKLAHVKIVYDKARPRIEITALPLGTPPQATH